MLKILGRNSLINVRKVLWLCSELDIVWEHEPWGEDPQSLHSPQFMALNPNAMVPVIIEDDFVMWESNAILRYLANSNDGEWLYPDNPRARAGRSVDGLAGHRAQHLMALCFYVAGAEFASPSGSAPAGCRHQRLEPHHGYSQSAAGKNRALRCGP